MVVVVLTDLVFAKFRRNRLQAAYRASFLSTPPAYQGTTTGTGGVGDSLNLTMVLERR